jgi:hypothetical protein
MLLPEEIHPEESIYYNGAFVLRELRQKPTSILELYGKVKANKNMSFPIFVLCIDWLYLIEKVELTEKGEIELCS